MENIPDFLEGVKNGNERLMGFGHRVYKNYDPRARIIKKHVDEVLEVTGKNPKLEIAVELEKHALDDEYFTSRKLYPNVDFYSGLIYEALRLPTEMFTVMFAIPRTSGWVAQWLEMIDDTEQKIARPRQIYTGERDGTSWRSEERGEPAAGAFTRLRTTTSPPRAGSITTPRMIVRSPGLLVGASSTRDSTTQHHLHLECRERGADAAAHAAAERDPGVGRRGVLEPALGAERERVGPEWRLSRWTRAIAGNTTVPAGRR